MTRFLLLLLLLIPSSLWAAVTVDGTPQTAKTSSGTTVTIPITIAGTDRELLCGVALPLYLDNTISVSSVVWNGSETLVFVKEGHNGGTKSEFWALLGANGTRVEPSTGTHNVVVTVSATTEITAGCISLNGVDPTNPLWASASAVGTSAAPSVTVASATGQLVFDFLAVTSAVGSSPSVGAGQTTRYSIVGTGSFATEAWSSSQPGATSVTNTYTISSSWNWAMVAVPVNPVGGAAQGGGGGGGGGGSVFSYCDKVHTSTHALYDPNVQFCADFEAPTLYLNDATQIGAGPPYFGPWYDATGLNSGGFYDRGRNSYWAQTYGPGSGTLWVSGEPINPTFGGSCLYPPGTFQGCNGTKVYDLTDRWSANAYHPPMQIVRNGEFGGYIPGETAPTHNSTGGAGPFEGVASLGLLVDRTTPLGILGGKGFPAGTIRNFSITMAVALASNMETENPVVSTNWKFNEWPVAGVGPGDGIFLFGLAGTLNTTFPFYQFSFFVPSSCPVCIQAGINAYNACIAAGGTVNDCQIQQSLAQVAQQVVFCNAHLDLAPLAGSNRCDGNGNLIYEAKPTVYNRQSEWPVATWACFQGEFSNWGLTNSNVRIYFTGPAGIRKKVIDVTADMTMQAAAPGVGGYVFNAYANTNSTASGVGSILVGPTARYEDNIHITTGSTARTCASIGYGASSGDTTPPGVPQNPQVTFLERMF